MDPETMGQDYGRGCRSKPGKCSTLRLRPQALDVLHSCLLRRLGFMKAMTALGVLVETPSATPRPYRLMGGQISSVWFDRYDLHPDSKEHVESIEETFAKLDAFVTKFIASGTPPDKVVIGGFSMGGGMALQYAFRTKHKLGGVFALSSYVNTGAAVYKLIAAANKDSLPPVFMRHGTVRVGSLTSH